MRKIGALFIVLAGTIMVAGGPPAAAENRTPSPEELREIIRQYNESGKYSGLQRQPQPQVPKGAAEFNQAVALQTRKNPSAADLKEAASLYQIAYDAGIVPAGTNLALLYLEGKGVKKDVKKALALLQSAAKKNNSQAEVVLARLYLIGTDVPRDEKKAEALLHKAAKAGNQNAVTMLAEYKEWKKKNELAQKQYQDLLKQVQAVQVKPGGATQPLQLFPQPKTGLTIPPGRIESPFPVIPGAAFFAGNQIPPNFLSTSLPQAPPQPLQVIPAGTPQMKPVAMPVQPASPGPQPIGTVSELPLPGSSK